MDTVTVDVTYWDLARQRHRLAALSDLLSAEETARAARLAIPVVRERFVLAHGILRETLGALVGAGPEALRFIRGPDGKPALAGDARIQFNLSRSLDGLLIATAESAVGCDVEQVRRNAEAPAIAARWFSAAEQAALARSEGDAFDRAFLTLWVRKEALLKAVGTGLQGSLGVDTGDLAPASTPRPTPLAGRDLWLQDIAPTAGTVAAIVADRPMTVRLSVNA